MSLIDKRAEYFYQAVSNGGIRAAADALNISPSVLSRQIASLEKSLGVILLERHSKGAIPTPSGEKVLLHYKQMIQSQNTLKEELDFMQGLKSGRVHISTGVGYLNYISQIINGFSANYPNITIEIGVHSSSEIIRKVIDGETDIGLLYNSINHPNLRSHFKTTHKLCVFMNPKHPLADKDEIELNDLLTQKIALTDRSYGIRQAVAAIESALGLVLPTALLCNDMNLLKRYAAAGGVTILPEFMLHNEKDLTFRPLCLPTKPNTKINIHADTQVITRRGRHLSVATKAMLGQMMAVFKSNQ